MCPQCNHPLIARKGSINRHHFGHAADSVCTGAPETALHLIAKEIIYSRLRLALPELVAEYNGVTLQVVKAQTVFFDSAIKEFRHEVGIIPDIFVVKNDRKLMVEIFVTHECDEEKISEISKTGVPSVEIDLSKFPRDATPSEIEDAVISSASRRWLYHPREVAAREQMKIQAEEIRRVKEREEENARKELERKVDTLVRYYHMGVRKLENLDNQNAEILSRINAAGFSNILGISFGGEGVFNFPTDVWQAEIVEKFIISSGADVAPKASAIYNHLKGVGAVGHQFKFVHPEVEKLLQKKIDKFVSPYTAVKAYLEYLVELGVLVFRRGYFASSLTVRGIDKVNESNRLRRQRAIDIRKKFNSIVLGLSDNSIRSFGFENWKKIPQASFGSSFEEAIENGNSFVQMYQGLVDIERMLSGHGLIVDDWLNFPIRREVERRRTFLMEEDERKRIEARRKDEEAHEKRVQVFLNLARSVHEGTADQWIVLPNLNCDGQTPIEMAEAGADSYHLIMAQLNREQNEKLERQWEEEKRRESERRNAIFAEDRLREVESWREKLRKRAVNSLGEDKARAFLASPYPQLKGKRPKDYCVDKETYGLCETLMNGVKKRSRKMF
tara:strand:+ start:585 stop:2426 length:1842 start_codon:yes stop_codon:yes gene_type:complete